jgi:Skp family chaperone for outer membrane proteins
LRLNDSLRVLTSIMEKTAHKSLGVISTDYIIEEITNRDAGQARLHSLFESLYQFYYFLEDM